MSLKDGTSTLNYAVEGEYAEVTVVPVATAGPCNSSCHTIYPFLILLFFMTFIVAVTQMPLLMIVLRSVSEEERSFALGMQFVIFRLFGYIPAPILFGNLIDSTCLLWKSTCGSKGGRCLLYDIEQFRYRYVGLCAGIKILALVFEEKPHHEISGHKRNPSSVSAYECPGSPKVPAASQENDAQKDHASDVSDELSPEVMDQPVPQFDNANLKRRHM
ncbi:hypothetical protein NQ315_010203 [Exocentrus adspersus]|uniref:Solute carrier organic anion transporter family member 5A1 n=1 Tax=Exocentrus adspersus TaxID=1586481 RepID=A0AAV8WAY4_9CUCU|nr:hypothetical protein NQ315_010203 [Exocentrus adspersus]